MPYLLNIGYLLLILAALPWLLRTGRAQGQIPRGLRRQIPRPGAAADLGRKCVWLHAVSVGEVNLLAPLLRVVAAERLDWECVVSTTTMTGMALAKKKYPGLSVFYCPLDFTWAVGAAMRRIRAGPAGAGRAGAVAEPGAGRPPQRRPRGGDQRAAERA